LKPARILAALVVMAALNPFVQAQQDPPLDLPKLSEVIDVRVINVDVVVTDRKGMPITGLTKDDFELYENGQPKPITNFFEVEGTRAVNQVVEAPATPAPTAATPPPIVRIDETPENLRRRIIFYIDNLSLAPFNRNRVFTNMKDFLKNVMRPGDEAMVATYNRSMKVRVPFTRDHRQIEIMLDTLAGESGLGIAARSERRGVEERIRESSSYSEAMSTARSYAQSVEHDLRQSVASINGLMTTLAGVEGKKILVLTSEGFPMQPGREAFYMVDEIGREKGWSNVGSTMLESMHFDSSNLIQQVAKTANANGITMYTVHAAGLTGGTEMSAEHRQPVPVSVSTAAIQNTTESMQLMADLTGGLASVNTNNFDGAFKRIARDLEAYYSLGYRAGTERVDRQRYISVKVKNREYVVRNRQTFVEKSVYAEMSDRAVANLLYQTKDNDLKILARIGQARPTDDGFFRVPVDIHIPMTSLTLMPQGDAEHVGGFDVYVVVANKDNDMSDVARKSHQVRVPAERMKDLGGKYYTYTLDMLIERGLNKISIGVVDQISNVTGFTREQIIAQNR
jgi:VWFA-related protein